MAVGGEHDDCRIAARPLRRVDVGRERDATVDRHALVGEEPAAEPLHGDRLELPAGELMLVKAWSFQRDQVVEPRGHDDSPGTLAVGESLSASSWRRSLSVAT